MRKVAPEKGSLVPEPDHVLRYIRPRHVESGVVNGEAFLTRPGEEAPSVNWLEWFDPPIENQVASVSNVARLAYAKTGHLARLNVGQTIQYVKDNDPNGLSLSFVHDRLEANEQYPADPSHCLVRGVPVQDTPEAALVKDLIADCILPPLFPAVRSTAPEQN
jgi:hypothetical protein